MSQGQQRCTCTPVATTTSMPWPGAADTRADPSPAPTRAATSTNDSPRTHSNSYKINQTNNQAITQAAITRNLALPASGGPLVVR